MKNTLRIIALVALTIGFSNSCKKDVAEPAPEVEIKVVEEEVKPVIQEKNKAAKAYLKDVMNEIYYWYKNIPTNIDTKPLDIYSCFDTLLYRKDDRWSWMMTGKEYLNNEQGNSAGYGASIVQAIQYYNDYRLWISYVYPNSPFAQNGVQRGWQLTKINNTPVMTLIQNNQYYFEIRKATNTFTFNDRSGAEKTITTSSQEYNSRSILTSKIFTNTDFDGLSEPVGYLHYLTFNANMTSDIDNAMTQFKTAGVTNVVLDLRYNHGGDASACNYLASYLAPESANNQTLSKYRHNEKNSQYDGSTESKIKRTANSLNIKKLYVLSGEQTASASEIIINGLKPLMNVIQVGATTYGKPAGMYVIPYPQSNYTSPEFVFLPICFIIVNKDGYGDYLHGLIPDNYRADDVYHDFGVDEDLIHACLVHIKSGIFPELPAIPTTKSAPTERAILAQPPIKYSYKIKPNSL